MLGEKKIHSKATDQDFVLYVAGLPSATENLPPGSKVAADWLMRSSAQPETEGSRHERTDRRCDGRTARGTTEPRILSRRTAKVSRHASDGLFRGPGYEPGTGDGRVLGESLTFIRAPQGESKTKLGCLRVTPLVSAVRLVLHAVCTGSMNLEANMSSPEVDIDVNVVSSPEPSPRPLESPQPGQTGISKKGIGVITPVPSLPLSAAAAAAAAAASVSNGTVSLGSNGTPSTQDAAMLSRYSSGNDGEFVPNQREYPFDKVLKVSADDKTMTSGAKMWHHR
uniref:Uncharacterized protein n=1 Tax=Anopheles culicifacies TaxID=139723 RepID=A0A182M4Z5_9DIPT